MLNFTDVQKNIYQITFSFPDKHKSMKEQTYTYAKLSRKIVNPENPEDYVWETVDEVSAKCNHTHWQFDKKGKFLGPDKFNKYMGRKTAFTKLLNKNFDREVRKALWFLFLDKYGRG